MAVLCIVAVDKKGILDIRVKTTADDKWVKGLTATKNAADFTVSISDTKTTLLHKAAGEVKAGDINYVVVPAGEKIAIYNGDLLLNTTKTGLTEGKYYTITSGPTKGTETATLANGTTETVEWVQLWAGGPRFATKNVAEEMTWTDATKTGKEYVWGENWRTPTAEEVEVEGGLLFDWSTGQAQAGSPTFTITIAPDGTEETVVFTGVQPGYTKNTLILYKKVVNGYNQFDFWTSTKFEGWGCKFIIWRKDNMTWGFGISKRHDPNKEKYLVRPVLSIENITNNPK